MDIPHWQVILTFPHFGFGGKNLKLSTKQQTLVYRTQQVIRYLVPFLVKRNSKCSDTFMELRNQ
jgi:hypothetical protein